MPSPHQFEFIVDDCLNGRRIDTVLLRHLRNYTPFRLQRMVRAGFVSSNNSTLSLKHRVFSGQQVVVLLVEPPDKLITPEPIPLDILYEDEWLIVVNKPAGQVVHPASRHQSGTLANALQYHLDKQTTLRGILRPGIVHRLDRETSGLMVVTKQHAAHYVLGQAFEHSKVQKTYLALVEGRLDDDSGTIELPIGRFPGTHTILMSAQPNARSAREAITEYSVRERFEQHTLVEARPLSGRLHQIRVHLATIGHPVVGDEFYGPCGEIRPGREEQFEQAHIGEQATMSRHALHANSLSFVHPVTSSPVIFHAPLSEDIQVFIQAIRSA